MPIDLPAMLTEQQEAWQAVFEIHSAMPHGWVLVGGQAVYLHAIERGAPFVRPTKDADMALDIRAYPTMLHDFTALLVKLDFESAGESHEGHQHRWKRGDAIWTSSSHGSWANGQTTAAESPEAPQSQLLPASKP